MSLYEEYYSHQYENKKSNDPAKVALFGILADMSDRSGILDTVDDDIKEEMLESWLSSIKTSLNLETVQYLQSCRSLLDAVSAEEVDDPEEYLNSFGCDGADYSKAISTVLEGFGHDK